MNRHLRRPSRTLVSERQLGPLCDFRPGMSGKGGASSQCLHLREPHPGLSAGTPCPPFDVYPECEEPQAENSFATGAGNWIQGVRWAAKLGARKSLKALNQVGEAVDSQQHGDGSRHEPRSEQQVGQAEDVEAEEHGVERVANVRQVSRQGCQRLELRRREALASGCLPRRISGAN